MSELITVPGPSVANVSRPDAIEQLYSHPKFPKNARLADIYEDGGKWVAKLKVAEFPPSDDGGEDEAPKPPKKNKDDFAGPNGDNNDEPIDEGSSDSDSDSGGDSDGGSDKPGGKGEKGELHVLDQKIDALLTALGIPVPGGDADSPVPGPDGADAPDAGPVPPPPPGAGAPPHGGPGGGKGPGFPTRGLKPGEAPPGSTPVGAPAFASTQKENPFPEYIGKAQSFEVSDFTNKPLGECVREIKALVQPWGYHVHQAKSEIDQNTGTRRVAALVADHPPRVNQ